MPRKKISVQEEIADDLVKEEGEETITGYSVVLDSIRNDMETPESFALKFSVLMRLPVTKVKHMVSRLPNTIWTGKKRAKAKMLLELMEEAGGVGRIVENHERPNMADRAENKQAKSGELCRKCGFPLKKTDQFCNFCMTSVQELQGRPVANKPVVEKSPMIPTARFLFYFALLLAGIILAAVLR
jgi:hypothetical protein